MARKREPEVFMWDLGSSLHRMTVEAVPARARVTHFWQPRADVYQTATGVLVRFELAGVELENLNLIYEAEAGVLRLRGSRTQPELPGVERVAIHQLEILYGSFEREVTLPEGDYCPEHITADLTGGILSVFLERFDR